MTCGCADHIGPGCPRYGETEEAKRMRIGILLLTYKDTSEFLPGRPRDWIYYKTTAIGQDWKLLLTEEDYKRLNDAVSTFYKIDL